VTTKEPRALQNPLAIKLLAQRLRQKLMIGYRAEDVFAVMLANLTDEELVAKYVDRTEPKPPQPKLRMRLTWR
jgi:hypothetical protein